MNEPHQQAGQADVMDGPGPKREEAGEPSPMPIPLGLRFAIVFLRLTVIMAFFMTVGTGMGRSSFWRRARLRAVLFRTSS